ISPDRTRSSSWCRGTCCGRRSRRSASCPRWIARRSWRRSGTKPLRSAAPPCASAASGRSSGCARRFGGCMGSIDRARLERRARRALVGVLPLLPIVLLATQLSERLVSTLAFGAATFVLAGVLLWYGRAPQKAVLPGVTWGLVPLGFALVANQVHVCGPNGCS